MGVPVLALDTTLDALVGHPIASPSPASKKRGPQKKIRQQLERIEAPPAAERRAIVRVIDFVLAAHQ